jgi:hypothetical protein
MLFTAKPWHGHVTIYKIVPPAKRVVQIYIAASAADYIDIDAQTCRTEMNL